ncbi:helix-turn-helix domain-containing protein [Micrococcus antarcticus]|uniref:helix-turn-helix domain-containing protein n=1 Tax=Micrococcus antarcticus TaxID=86171 RepID=UPI00384A6CA1
MPQVVVLSSTSSEPEVSIAQAAELLGIGYSTARRWVQEGRLPARRLGKRVARIRLADIQSMLDTTERPVDPVDAHIDALVAAAPPLSDSQIRRLQSLLGGAAA